MQKTEEKVHFVKNVNNKKKLETLLAEVEETEGEVISILKR